MNYNKYVAFGFAQGRIAVTIPCNTMYEAAKMFFKENKQEGQCSIRRVAVSFGQPFNDPDFEIRRVDRNNFLDKLKRA